MSEFNIRRASEEDVDEIYRMLRELAAHLKEPDAVTTTPEKLRQDQKLYQCMVAESMTAGGFALYVYKYDACKGQMAILDSFYVAPENRSRGIGLSLMKAVEQDVAECGCSQMEMLVHDWNARAIEFYLKRSAVNYTDQMHWHIYRIPLSNISKT
ncbi:diamine acetyltransferase 2-like isoform X3 [Mizuhopecten yessoensis]|uniref:diamine acetyltransferase 2-like isoform X3 n=1 Tax=Mizuhopecten yessoensis TaxID=6573 RepID=UPI000B45848B|nr:diamine acetyltransferase 2-like isoform X3 [Mizuhopecten yessoensis]